MAEKSKSKGPASAKRPGKAASAKEVADKSQMQNNRRGKIRELERGHANAPRVQPDQSRSQDAKRDAKRSVKREKRSAA